jgi:hypothetical protein
MRSADSSPAAPAPPSAPAPPHKDQPAHVKIKLGHYRNDQRGIGVTIDLTEKNESVARPDPAKLRFDGETKVWRLEGRRGPDGRIDYVAGKMVVLHVWADGRRAVYVIDPETGPSGDAIDVHRDGDADPL